MVLDIKSFVWFTSLMKKFGLHNQVYLTHSYHLSIEKVDIPSKKQFLGSKEQCRYCGAYNKNAKSVKEKIAKGDILLDQTASFKKIAHALPTLIGNVNIISKDECDTCNERFSAFENSLVSFLGINRTLSKIKGRRGIPKTKLNDHEFVDISGQDLIIATYEDSDVYEEKNNIITITSKKKYIPNEVHKCFVKMALSILPLDKLRDFSKTIAWLLNDTDLGEEYQNQLYVNETKWPHKNTFPFVFIDIYERKSDRLDIPFMFARICFNNFAFQFPIPLCSLDVFVQNFNIPVTVKHEYQYPELLDNYKLWTQILNDTTIRKIDLSSQLKVEEIDKQYYKLTERGNASTLDDLPDNILQYINKSKLLPK